MNRPLRGYDGSWGWSHYKGVGNVPLDREYGEDHIKSLYSALKKSVTKKDMWLQRGNENWEGVEGFFGVKIYQSRLTKVCWKRGYRLEFLLLWNSKRHRI